MSFYPAIIIFFSKSYIFYSYVFFYLSQHENTFKTIGSMQMFNVSYTN